MSTGPHDTSQTRYNALKTGLTAQGLSPMDDTESFNNLETQLRTQFAPEGPLEDFLVRRIALGMVRRQRGERLEAAMLDCDLQRDLFSLDPFRGMEIVSKAISEETVSGLCNLSGRYETATARRLDSDIKQLINLQQLRGKNGFVS